MENKNYIVTAVTNEYAEYLYTFLYSILKNSKYEDYVVIIIHNGIKNEIVENSIKISGPLNVVFRELSTIPGAEILKTLTQPTYWRLLVDDVVPEGVKRCVYLDLDVLVLGDLMPLFNYDLSGNTIGACIDYLPRIQDGISNWEQLELDPEKPYFNAGMLLIDLIRFKDRNIANIVVGSVLNNSEYLLAKGKWPQNDQYGLNVALIDDWQVLPRIYNYGSGLDYQVPVVLHYIGGGKPGSKRCQPEFTSLYEKYSNDVVIILK